jgi:serine/threonine protein phosphatase PrpC
LDNSITQLTNDQTFVAREIKKGTMTVEQAKNDKRRNMAFQLSFQSPWLVKVYSIKINVKYRIGKPVIF